ncbi:hypothetical protein A3D00_05070 [Candidatus Woesebacteria bacterium RIFCSPHIGHO2_02_FULL_38_9]|uniref:Glycosyltransferase RgtA/B/C/D-like domain-containing protein n=1 Tax=Candidatus Woesebacteria bacterium RIFCSPHIGHO2_01_FULL_39_28 TaxID=1802496 RepID=A0A1F7YC29_9BACT|nr:MAG: hypothetical protein A2627_02865 [Candidatus Woesebacteria bacterium RIFCSPHIGHO2_01_FULL_39_28]OGM32357.1 MAG: hypothetical protein A3D00_05070 [Candidatus Woesebacteria bacterium RIFCSPHIGHO2_02_FULL_38_9]OGM57990.1 MAG: hypothetical protein A3A50_01875 [Candidatus Woesebacteria bacterium RIFCSPLOWO2_01_FULL_38_20]
MKKFLKNYINFLISIFLFALTLVIVGKNLNKPFWGIHDWNGARYGNIARNYVRYGYFTTKFSQIENGGVYTHYPPMLPILISFSYKFFRVNEWATRLVPVLATSGLIIIIYLIGRTIFSNKIGLTASLLALATPMIRYYGKNPVHEPLALFFASLAFLGAAKFTKKKNTGWNLILIGIVLTSLTNWSSVFLVLAITLILVGKVSHKEIIKLWIINLSLILLHFLSIYLVTGSFFGGGILDSLIQRTSLGGASSQTKFSLFEFINRVRLWSSNLFTISLLVTSFIGTYFVFKSRTSFVKRFVFGTFIYCAGYPLVFLNATFIHEYFIFYLVLPISLLASFGLSKIFEKKTLWLLTSIALIALVWFERARYMKALEVSNIDGLAVQIGKELNQKVLKDEQVLIEPYAFAASRLPHLSFYSDRKITLDRNSSYNWSLEVDETGGDYNRVQENPAFKAGMN